MDRVQKISYLLVDITKGVLEASKCTILADQAVLWLTFASATKYVMEFIESTSADSSGNNRNISEFCGNRTGDRNRNGHGGGKANIHGGRGGGLGGRVRQRKWLKEEVEACTYFTEHCYSNE